MVAYPYTMPTGIAGAITRPENSTIEQAIMDQTTPPLAYGVGVKKVSGKLQPISTSSDVPIGILVRPFPSTSGSASEGLAVATPNKAFPGSYLKRGYISALLNNFAAVPSAQQGAVYIRTGNASTGKVVGNFEAAGEAVVTAGATVGTGTQTAGTLSATPATPAGIYQVVMTTGSLFNVIDANNDILFTGGTFANTYTLDNGLTFRMTTGGTPTAGDKTPITVVQNAILLPGNSYFTGAPDATGIIEVAYNI